MMETELIVNFKSSTNLSTYLYLEIKKLIESKGATEVSVHRIK